MPSSIQGINIEPRGVEPVAEAGKEAGKKERGGVKAPVVPSCSLS